jgi:hypothetical protein
LNFAVTAAVGFEDSSFVSFIFAVTVFVDFAEQIREDEG